MTPDTHFDAERNTSPARERAPVPPTLCVPTHPLIRVIVFPEWSQGPDEPMTSAERRDLAEAIAALRKLLSRR